MLSIYFGKREDRDSLETRAEQDAWREVNSGFFSTQGVPVERVRLSDLFFTPYGALRHIDLDALHTRNVPFLHMTCFDNFLDYDLDGGLNHLPLSSHFFRSVVSNNAANLQFGMRPGMEVAFSEIHFTILSLWGDPEGTTPPEIDSVLLAPSELIINDWAEYDRWLRNKPRPSDPDFAREPTMTEAEYYRDLNDRRSADDLEVSTFELTKIGEYC